MLLNYFLFEIGFNHIFQQKILNERTIVKVGVVDRRGMVKVIQTEPVSYYSLNFPELYSIKKHTLAFFWETLHCTIL